MEPKSQLPRKSQPSSCDSQLKPSDVEISSIFSNNGLPSSVSLPHSLEGPGGVWAPGKMKQIQLSQYSKILA